MNVSTTSLNMMSCSVSIVWIIVYQTLKTSLCSVIVIIVPISILSRPQPELLYMVCSLSFNCAIFLRHPWILSMVDLFAFLNSLSSSRTSRVEERSSTWLACAINFEMQYSIRRSIWKTRKKHILTESEQGNKLLSDGIQLILSE